MMSGQGGLLVFFGVGVTKVNLGREKEYPGLLNRRIIDVMKPLHCAEVLVTPELLSRENVNVPRVCRSQGTMIG